jgi:hypothetical protein
MCSPTFIFGDFRVSFKNFEFSLVKPSLPDLKIGIGALELRSHAEPTPGASHARWLCAVGPPRRPCHTMSRRQLAPPHPVTTLALLSPPPNLSTRGTCRRPVAVRHAPSRCLPPLPIACSASQPSLRGEAPSPCTLGCQAKASYWKAGAPKCIRTLSSAGIGAIHGAPHPAPLHRHLSTPKPSQDTTAASPATSLPPLPTRSPEQKQRRPKIHGAAEHRH